jgi:hypothetical protein
LLSLLNYQIIIPSFGGKKMSFGVHKFTVNIWWIFFPLVSEFSVFSHHGLSSKTIREGWCGARSWSSGIEERWFFSPFLGTSERQDALIWPGCSFAVPQPLPQCLSQGSLHLSNLLPPSSRYCSARFIVIVSYVSGSNPSTEHPIFCLSGSFFMIFVQLKQLFSGTSRKQDRSI